ncbi:hypothetical protein AB6864_26335 [Serratia proteamaculans]|nr:hypothetical protein [Serratia proteamaculans]RYM50744.1 hypothetical protein BSQ97_15405 [Serratia proteamaculans]
MENIRTDIEKAVKERAAGPLGYVTLSFIVYNWSWFYFVLFSSKSAEVKIASVISGFQKWPGFGWPIVVGLALQVGTPYLKMSIAALTSLAKNLEIRIEHYSDNYLELLKEKTKQLLINKRLEITEAGTKIDSLIQERDVLNDEIKRLQEKTNNLRKEEMDVSEAIGNATKERHNLEVFLATNNTTKERFESFTKEIQQKSIENTNIKNAFLSTRSCADKLSKIAINMERTPGIMTESDSMELATVMTELHEVPSLIKGDFVAIDGAHFNDEKNEMLIPQSVSEAKIQSFLYLIQSKGFSASLGIVEPNGTTIVKFARKLEPLEKRGVISYYEEATI